MPTLVDDVIIHERIFVNKLVAVRVPSATIGTLGISLIKSNFETFCNNFLTFCDYWAYYWEDDFLRVDYLYIHPSSVSIFGDFT